MRRLRARMLNLNLAPKNHTSIKKQNELHLENVLHQR